MLRRRPRGKRALTVHVEVANTPEQQEAASAEEPRAWPPRKGRRAAWCENQKRNSEGDHARKQQEGERRFQERSARAHQSGTSIRIMPSCRELRKISPSPLRLRCRSARVAVAPFVASTSSWNVTYVRLPLASLT